MERGFKCLLDNESKVLSESNYANCRQQGFFAGIWHQAGVMICSSKCLRECSGVTMDFERGTNSGSI